MIKPAELAKKRQELGNEFSMMLLPTRRHHLTLPILKLLTRARNGKLKKIIDIFAIKPKVWTPSPHYNAKKSSFPASSRSPSKKAKAAQNQGWQVRKQLSYLQRKS